MSYRELTMIDVKELLRRWAAGHSNRKIARETGAELRRLGRLGGALIIAGIVLVATGKVTEHRKDVSVENA